MIHELQTLNSNYALHHTSTLFYNLLDPLGQITFTFPLKTRGASNYGFASWQAVPLSILQIVLQDTPFLKVYLAAS